RTARPRPHPRRVAQPPGPVARAHLLRHLPVALRLADQAPGVGHDRRPRPHALRGPPRHHGRPGRVLRGGQLVVGRTPGVAVGPRSPLVTTTAIAPERNEEPIPSAAAPDTGERTWRAALAAITAVGLAIRVVFVVATRHLLLWGDASYYHYTANLLVTGHGL